MAFNQNPFDQNASLLNTAVTVKVVSKMAVSHYLFFDCYKNLAICLEFCLLVIPRMQARDDGGAAEKLKGMLENLTSVPKHMSLRQFKLKNYARASDGQIGKSKRRPEEAWTLKQ
jgi:hypothetical protein